MLFRVANTDKHVRFAPVNVLSCGHSLRFHSNWISCIDKIVLQSYSAQRKSIVNSTCFLFYFGIWSKLESGMVAHSIVFFTDLF